MYRSRGTIAGVLVTLLLPGTALAQVTSVQGRLEGGRLNRSQVTNEMRLGAAVAVEHATEDGAGRLVLAFVPESQTQPGWQAFTLEAAPWLVNASRVRLALRVSGGAHHMSTGKHNARVAGCSRVNFCLNEGSFYGTGWAALMGGGAEIAGRVAGPVSLTGSFGLGYLLGGPNSQTMLASWSIGLGYLF